jgi:outer membrane lipoprotein LolB
VICRLLAVAAVALAGGCAQVPTPPGEAPWTTGRMSLRVEATPERPLQNLSVAFELRGSGNRGELRLNSPLGTQLAAARWSPGLASLRTAEGEREFADLTALSRQALGEPLPLAALPDWLTGQPWPGAPFVGQPDGFEQLGWRVQTERQAEGWITARRDSPPAVQLRFRLDRAEP